VVATNPLLKRFSRKKAPVLVSLGLAVCLLIGLGSWLLLLLASHSDQRYASQSRNTPTHQTVSSPTNTASVLNTQAPSKPTAQPDPTTQPVSIVRLILTPTPTVDSIVRLTPTPTTATDPIVRPTPTPTPIPNPIVQPTPTPVPNVSLPVASCSSVGSLVEADGVYSGGSEVGVLDTYYNSSTGDNCVYFQSLGAARGVLKKMFVTIIACMQTTSGSICTGGLTNGSSSDSGNYYYYAGPVGVYAKGRCINASGGMVWNGVTYKIGTTPAASHCGS
jgi:hypothetical protein